MKGKIRNSIIACFLTLSLMIQMMPSGLIHAFAEVTSEGVRILVKEGEQPLKDATVEFVITSQTDDDRPTQTKTTDENGYVEVLAATEYQDGEFDIIATISKDGYVSDITTLSHKPISAANEIFEISLSKVISFPKEKVNYVFGEDLTSIEAVLGSELTPAPTITYSIDQNTIGLSCDQNSGKIQIDDYELLYNELVNHNGKLDIQVDAVAENPHGKATYVLNISFCDVPENIYEIVGEKGKDGWYRALPDKSHVEVKLKDAMKNQYELSQSYMPSSFQNMVVLSETKDMQYIYVRNRNTKGISKKIALMTDENASVKVDTTIPDIAKAEIKFNSLYPEQLLENLKSFIFNHKQSPENQSISFSIDVDNGSEIDMIEWYYFEEKNTDISNLVPEGIIQGSDLVLFDGKMTADIKMPINGDEEKQYRGYVAFVVIDKAGNRSGTINSCKDGIFIVDSISPTLSVSRNDSISERNDIGYYGKNGITYQFEITEDNFDIRDEKNNIGVYSVTLKNQEDGSIIDITKDGTWIDKADHKHVGTYEIKSNNQHGDGHYLITMEYTDAAQNQLESDVYEKEFILDTTKPVIQINQDRSSSDPDATIIQIIEKNFDPKNIRIKVNGKDLNGNILSQEYLDALNKRFNEAIQKEEYWQKENASDLHRFTYSDYLNGVYSFEISCLDLSNNEETYRSEITIDRELAKVNDVTPSKENHIITTETQNIRFYKNNAEFYLHVSKGDIPIKQIQWKYVKDETAAESNEISDFEWREVDLVNDLTQEDEYKVSLPNDKLYRGYLIVQVIDDYGNMSECYQDIHNVFVIDSISPILNNVDYTKENRIVNNISYYNKNVTLTFDLQEANFDASDFHLNVYKNNILMNHQSVNWKEKDRENYIGTYTITQEGDYVIEAHYVDHSGNQMKTFRSKNIVIDKTKPIIQVAYSNQNVIATMQDRDQQNRQYFNADQTSTVTIKEHNFQASDVEFHVYAKDVSGNEIADPKLYTRSEWKHNGDEHTIVFTFNGEANYDFDVAYADMATNQADDYAVDYFTVDKTAPKNLSVSYSDSVMDTTIGNISFGYYNSKTRVTLRAEDNISGVYGIVYSYINAENVSSLNAQLLNQAIKESQITYSDDHKVATITFDIPRSLLDRSHQFNGTVKFTASDRSRNESAREERRRIVVDNITPTIQVGYNDPVNQEDQISYYDGAINGTIMVNEANFYAQDVFVRVSKDGQSSQGIPVNWTRVGNDEYQGTFTLSSDGDYIVSVDYADRSGNTIVPYRSNQLTIDTGISDPIITINGSEADHQAFKDEVRPSVQFEDENFDDYEIKMTRTRYQSRDEDVSTAMVNQGVSVHANGGNGTFDAFKKEPDIDGIYRIDVQMKDKAGHTSEATKTFTVNRFGSVYEYNDYLGGLIKDGGAYVNSIDQDLIITEYNADRLVEDSLNIEITKDGQPLNEVDYTSSPINAQVSTGSSGWFQYQYTIGKENFATDGVYKISVSSKDSTGNAPENSNYEDKHILFRVDSTAPEITSVIGLEDEIINAQEVNVRYSVFDSIGLKKVQVKVNGEIKDTIEQFNDDMNNFDGSFVINESGSSQDIQLVIEDLAGNITDTSSDDFNSAYTFRKTVTVSTNVFVRFYANKALFWGSIITCIAGISGLLYFFMTKKKDEEEQEQKS